MFSNSETLIFALMYSNDDTLRPNLALFPVTGSIFSTFLLNLSIPKALIISDPTIAGNKVAFSFASGIITSSIVAPKFSNLSQIISYASATSGSKFDVKGSFSFPKIIL